MYSLLKGMIFATWKIFLIIVNAEFYVKCTFSVIKGGNLLWKKFTGAFNFICLTQGLD